MQRCPAVRHSRVLELVLLVLASSVSFTWRRPGLVNSFVSPPCRSRLQLATHQYAPGKLGPRCRADATDHAAYLGRFCAVAMFVLVVAVGGSRADAEKSYVAVPGLAGNALTEYSQETKERANDDSSPIVKSLKEGPERLTKNVQKAKAVAEATIETVLQEGQQVVNSVKREGIGKTVESAEQVAMTIQKSIEEEGIQKTVQKELDAASDRAKAKMQSISELANELNVEKAAIRSLRGISSILDRMQADLYDESWMSLSIYPNSLRAYIPLLNYYADAFYPDSNDDGQAGNMNRLLRDDLVREAKSMFRAVSDFEDSVANKSVRESEKAFANVSLSYDRYVKAGKLFSGYTPREKLEAVVDDKQLKYKRLALGQPRVRDEILVIRGPDKGTPGKVIDIENDADGKPSMAVVKLNPDLMFGPFGSVTTVRQVNEYPYDWVALQDTSLDFATDFAAATLAAVFSCGLTLPIDSVKVRLQSGLPALPDNLGELFLGLPSNLGQYCIPGGIFLAGSNLLAAWAVTLPFVDGNNPDLKLLLLIPAGVVANSVTMPIRVPFEEMNKLIQTGVVPSESEAFQKVFLERSASQNFQNIATLCVIGLTRGIPFGALQVATYEIFKDKLGPLYEAADFPGQYELLVWGALAGAVTGYATNPPDVILSRTVSAGASAGQQQAEEQFDLERTLQKIGSATREIYDEEGLAAFNQGAAERTVYLAIEACLWFAAYEWLRKVFLIM